MIRTTEPKSGFLRSDNEGEQDVDIKKRPEDADRKKKQVGFCSGTIENSQNGKAEKAAQCQKWRNAIKSHGILNCFIQCPSINEDFCSSYGWTLFSISCACSSVARVIFSPPSILAISVTRSGSVKRVMVVVVLPRTTCFEILK